jgi:hypothetical protein
MVEEGKVLIFGGGEAVAAGEATRGLGRALRDAAGNASEVAVATLQENMRRFLTALDTIMSASPDQIGGLSLEQVEIQLQVDASGNVGISAIAGAEFSTQGGIKLVLRKRP